MVTLAELPALPCPYCGRVLGTDTPWAASAATLWGWCGAKLTVEDDVTGLLLVGPMEDAAQAMVMSAWVSPEHVGTGHGRQLVQRVAAGSEHLGADDEPVIDELPVERMSGDRFVLGETGGGEAAQDLVAVDVDLGERVPERSGVRFAHRGSGWSSLAAAASASASASTR